MLQKLSRHSLVLLLSLLLLVSSATALTESASSPTLDKANTLESLHTLHNQLHQHTAMQHTFSVPAITDKATAERAARSSSRRKLRLGSLNIRYDVHSRHPLLKPALSLFHAALHPTTTEKKKWGEHRWSERRDQLVDQVLFHEFDVVGFQEVLDHQLEDLVQLMGGEKEWGHVGAGRDDGKKAGEAVPIFYRKSRLELVSTSQHWLSPTPSQPGSKGWDAGQPRMITFAHLRDLSTTTTFSSSRQHTDVIVANTHWDDRGLRAREESARLILRLVEAELAAAQARAAGEHTEEEGKEEPLVILLGDLNSPAEEAGYQVLTGGRYPADKQAEEKEASPSSSVAEGRSFFDARHELVRRGGGGGGGSTVPVSGGAMARRFGPLNTYTGFEPSDLPKKIDFILPFANSAFSPASPSFPTSPSADPASADPASKWRVARYGVVQNFFEDVGGRRGTGAGSRDAEDEAKRDAMVLSDHRLVVVALEESY